MSPAPAALALACLLLAAAARAQSGGDGGFTRDRSGGDFSGSGLPAMQPIPIFYPPSPPPLGQAVPTAAVAAGPGRNVAPAGLADFVNECFYPQLGTRLAARSLPDKLRARLDRYRTDKLALQGALRAELERLRDAEAEARAAALAAFARKQAPQLAALEAAAEELRRDLATGEQHWSALREWRLGDRSQRGFSPAEIGQVMRGYAFYENGLLPAQRRLLREIHLEMAAAMPDAAHATVAQPYLFFPPEPARVLLPDDLPAEVAAQLAAYQTKKSRLKKELYDAVAAYEAQRFGWIRPNPLKALAATQQPALAELEALAEEIRRGLARFAAPSALAERSPVPPVLQARIAAAALTAAQRAASARLNEIFAAHRDVRMQTAVRFEPDGLRIVIVPAAPGRGRGGPPPAPDPRLAAVRTAAAAVAEDYGRQAADLVNEFNAIRAAIAQALGTARAGAIDHVLGAAMRVASARENDPLYGDYRIAVFQPGLSPEQRRLLFDGVVERLALPLPRGEPQPTGRSQRW
jgi:hypothetical protein